MILMMVIVLVFPLLKMAVPGNELIAKIAGKVDGILLYHHRTAL